jgi:hypothetical protein
MVSTNSWYMPGRSVLLASGVKDAVATIKTAELTKSLLPEHCGIYTCLELHWGEDYLWYFILARTPTVVV